MNTRTRARLLFVAASLLLGVNVVAFIGAHDWLGLPGSGICFACMLSLERKL